MWVCVMSSCVIWRKGIKEKFSRSKHDFFCLLAPLGRWPPSGWPIHGQKSLLKGKGSGNNFCRRFEKCGKVFTLLVTNSPTCALHFSGDELDKLIQGSSKPWMVQFYSSWCGHCIHFQPTFLEFGARVEGWWVVTLLTQYSQYYMFVVHVLAV